MTHLVKTVSKKSGSANFHVAIFSSWFICGLTSNGNSNDFINAPKGVLPQRRSSSLNGLSERGATGSLASASLILKTCERFWVEVYLCQGSKISCIKSLADKTTTPLVFHFHLSLLSMQILLPVGFPFSFPPTQTKPVNRFVKICQSKR